MQTELYRFFDADDVLLYVGISTNAAIRSCGHRSQSSWYDQAVKMTIERCGTREAALEAEMRAIVTENPLHNKAGVPNPPSRARKIYTLKRDGVLINSVVLGEIIGVRPVVLRKQAADGTCSVKPIGEIWPPVWHRNDVNAYLARQAPTL